MSVGRGLAGRLLGYNTSRKTRDEGRGTRAIMGAGRWTEETEEGGKSERLKEEIGNWKSGNLRAEITESRVEGREVEGRRQDY